MTLAIQPGFDFSVATSAPAQRHSETSVAAAKKIELRTGSLRGLVLDFIRGHNGATDEEIQTALHMNPSTERPRRIELVSAGLVVDSGKTRLTASGRQAVVWSPL